MWRWGGQNQIQISHEGEHDMAAKKRTATKLPAGRTGLAAAASSWRRI